MSLINPHLSRRRWIQRGAKPLTMHGTFDDALAFLNPDQSIVVILRNESAQEKALDLTIGENKIFGLMAADSFNTIVLNHNA